MKNNIEITELFMAQADRGRRFYGTIKRFRDKNGNWKVFGKIRVNDCYVISVADDQNELGKKLDEMVLLVLDYGIHKS